MSRLQEILRHKKFVVGVSLPRHDMALAKAACECGVDFVKVHANVHHKASGTHFGSWNEERAIIQEIVAGVKIPVGLMPGAETTVTPEEMQQAIDIGIDFFDIYDFHMPCWMLHLPIGKMIAVGEHFSLSEVEALEGLGMDFLEASIVSSALYRAPLVVKDLTHYELLASTCKKPVLVPSQKRIEPSHVGQLKQIGVQGIILGTISIGESVDEFTRRLPLFTDACNK